MQVKNSPTASLVNISCGVMSADPQRLLNSKILARF
jgi:hypothetical protein